MQKAFYQRKHFHWNMMTSLNGNIFRVTGPLCAVTGEFRSQRPVTRNFDVFCDLFSVSLYLIYRTSQEFYARFDTWCFCGQIYPYIYFFTKIALTKNIVFHRKLCIIPYHGYNHITSKFPLVMQNSTNSGCTRWSHFTDRR